MVNPCTNCRQSPGSCPCSLGQEYEEQKNSKSTKQIVDNSFYGISSPIEVESMKRNRRIQLLINDIELKLNSGNFLSFDDYVYVSITGEKYSKEIRDIVCQLYVNKGWKNATNETSSENGERGGLTSFKLYK